MVKEVAIKLTSCGVVSYFRAKITVAQRCCPNDTLAVDRTVQTPQPGEVALAVATELHEGVVR